MSRKTGWGWWAKEYSFGGANCDLLVVVGWGCDWGWRDWTGWTRFSSGIFGSR